MSTQSPPLTDPRFLLEGSPTGTLRYNLDRDRLSGNLTALTTQVMLSVALPLQPGDLVTNLTFTSGGTGAGTPTNYWFALYSPSGALLSQTADKTSTAWGTNTALTLPLATPHLVTLAMAQSGPYWAAIMVKATTTPTLLGAPALYNAIASGNLGTLGWKNLAQTSDSSLTTTAPATMGTATAVVNVPFVVAS